MFAFEDPIWKSGQVTWIVLPQEFRDSPHLFGLALTQDLAKWQYPCWIWDLKERWVSIPSPMDSTMSPASWQL
jgi:hypothetical protein